MIWRRRLTIFTALLFAAITVTPLLFSTPDVATGAQVTSTPAPTSTPRPLTTIHVVQRGDTVFKIAQRYGSTVEAIVRANGLADASRIQVGQRLIIPNAQPGSGTPDSAPGTLIEYTLGLTDTINTLAPRFGTTITSIARENRILNPENVYAGLRLLIPVGSEGRALLERGTLYTVQPADTLYGVAARFNQSAGTLQALNHLPEHARLYSGQTLVIPSERLLIALPAGMTALTMQPATPQQGRTQLFTFTLDRAALLSGTFLDQNLVFHSEDQRTYKVWLGVPALTVPGVYPLVITLTDEINPEAQTITRQIVVREGGYYREQIVLPANQLDLIDPKVTQPEIEQVMKIVAPVTPRRYLTAPFGLPVAAPVTSQYGTRRSYNGSPYDQFHTGTDFKGSVGSPIYAPAPGKVVFAAQLYVRGTATIIDHGWGVYTGYWHQSELLVKPGDEVATGQIIGKIGSTGRVTGPHLHWELFVNGVQVDPLQWVRTGLQ